MFSRDTNYQNERTIVIIFCISHILHSVSTRGLSFLTCPPIKIPVNRRNLHRGTG